MIRICAVVTGKTLEEFIRNLHKIQKISDFVELRVDYINSFDLQNIKVIKKETKKASIFTCRKRDEGGKFAGTEEERLAIIEAAAKSEFEYIDVELSSIQSLNIKGSRSKIIVSYHQFESTPSYRTLRNIVSVMKKTPSDYYKIATKVNNNSDIATLFQLLLDKTIHGHLIVIGMGEKGKIIRIIAPLFGGYLTYASTPYSQSAPGQITIDELQKVYKELDKVL